MSRWLAHKSLVTILLLGSVTPVNSVVRAEEAPKESEPRPLQLRKSVNQREYQGRTVEGEERVVALGDSLWRILVQEKGLPEKRFHYYVVLIRGLNPHLKSVDLLRVGDTIFLPLKPDEISGSPYQTAKPESSAKAPDTRASAQIYRVKRGDQLYRILREQLGAQGDKEREALHARIRDLNPQKKNWNFLREGEVIRLPSGGQISKSTAPIPQQRAPTAVGSDHARRLPARDNLILLGQVMEALGIEVQRNGQEILLLKEGTVRIDKDSYPVLFNRKLDQKVIVDPEEKIPPSLQARLDQQAGSSPVVSIRQGASLQEFINQALPLLGYQTLPTDRPVIIQDAGAGYEVKGSWIAMAPEESNRPQEILVINLTDKAEEIPDYLKSILSRNGITLKEIRVGSASRSQISSEIRYDLMDAKLRVRTWPQAKTAIIDAILETYGVNFSASRNIPVQLREGLSLDARCDRLLEVQGRKIAFFFSPVMDDIKRALQDKYATKPVELDLPTMSPRDLISRILAELGESTHYTEHRFPAVDGTSTDKLLVTAWGFLLTKKNLFVTDREIPQDLHRFFFEKGLQIIYF